MNCWVGIFSGMCSCMYNYVYRWLHVSNDGDSQKQLFIEGVTIPWSMIQWYSQWSVMLFCLNNNHYITKPKPNPSANRTTTLTLLMVGSCIRYFWIIDHWIKDHGIEWSESGELDELRKKHMLLRTLTLKLLTLNRKSVTVNGTSHRRTIIR